MNMQQAAQFLRAIMPDRLQHIRAGDYSIDLDDYSVQISDERNDAYQVYYAQYYPGDTDTCPEADLEPIGKPMSLRSCILYMARRVVIDTLEARAAAYEEPQEEEASKPKKDKVIPF